MPRRKCCCASPVADVGKSMVPTFSNWEWVGAPIVSATSANVAEINLVFFMAFAPRALT